MTNPPANVEIAPPIHLNPWQQWQYFSQPRQTAEWMHASQGQLASVAFQGQTYALVITLMA